MTVLVQSKNKDGQEHGKEKVQDEVKTYLDGRYFTINYNIVHDHKRSSISVCLYITIYFLNLM